MTVIKDLKAVLPKLPTNDLESMTTADMKQEFEQANVQPLAADFNSSKMDMLAWVRAKKAESQRARQAVQSTTASASQVETEVKTETTTTPATNSEEPK